MEAVWVFILYLEDVEAQPDKKNSDDSAGQRVACHLQSGLEQRPARIGAIVTITAVSVQPVDGRAS
jgi:hypothetical protein